MDLDKQYTPQKLLQIQQFNISSPAAATFKFLSQQQTSRITPQNKFLHSSISNTPGSIKKRSITNNSAANSNTAYNVFPILNTPPSRTRFTKVLNPFEAALTDRLHLPLICSPSLFQRPATPQHSSTQFEWTIEDVSSLGPANVEPHETQFLGDSLDPDVEAKAQAAISSYFKEQQIVPSPQNCSLRNQRIILSEISNNNNNNNSILMQSPIIKQPKRIRDSYTQTILTLPPILPLELENILKPFFNFHENQQQSPINNCDRYSNNMSVDYEARDASLRRKLFDIPNIKNNCGAADNNTSDDDEGLINCNEFSPPPKTPELDTPLLSLRHSNDSLDKSSFGALSPISKLISPRKNRKKYFDNDQEQGLQNSSILENIAPIKSSSPTIEFKRISPIIFVKKSSSPFKSIPTDFNQSIYKLERNKSSPDLTRMLVDTNFNGSIKNLIVNNFLDSNAIINNHNNDQKLYDHKYNSSQQKLKSLSNVDIFNQSGNYDDDVMQVSQLSTKSTSSTSSVNDTPRRRRSVGRKKLSQSFSCHFSDTEEDEINNDVCENYNHGDNEDGNKPLVKRRSSPNNNNENIFLPKTDNKNIKQQTVNKSIITKINFYRTDSGFNEMSTNTQDEIIQYTINLDNDKENVLKYPNLRNICNQRTSCKDVSINH